MEKQREMYLNKLSYETDTSDLKAAIEKRENIVIVDNRSEEAFEWEHIPGAINLPHGFINQDTIRRLNKNVVYACYCEGVGCNASTKGAYKLLKLGYKVTEVIGGLEWWKKNGFATVGEYTTEGSASPCSC